MAQTGSIAPKERVNIVYRPATGDAQEEVELPLKLLVLGDFSGRVDRDNDLPLEERRPAAIDKDTFDDVLRSHALALDLVVPNRIASAEAGGAQAGAQAPSGGELSVRLAFERLADFSPEAIAAQVPELAELLRLRTALTALKGPLGNLPAFRRKLQELVGNRTHHPRLLAEVGENHDVEEGQ